MPQYRLFYGKRPRHRPNMLQHIPTSYRFDEETDDRALKRAQQRLDHLTKTRSGQYVLIQLRRIIEPARDETFEVVKAMETTNATIVPEPTNITPRNRFEKTFLAQLV